MCWTVLCAARVWRVHQGTNQACKVKQDAATDLVLALKLLLLPLNGRQMRINVGQVRHKRLPGLSLLLLRAVCLAGQPLCILCNQALLLLHTVNININTLMRCAVHRHHQSII